MRILSALLLAATSYAGVSTIRVPDGGIQPQVVEKDGVVHLLYFSGDPAKGDIYYTRSRDYGTFSKPIQVNHTPGSALAMGNIRGPQIAIGRNNRVHVAWNGSGPKAPMYYTRINDAGTAFEPERAVDRDPFGLDGGSIAADTQGNVYVFWHAPGPGAKDESGRRVWMAKSSDDGKNFDHETIVFGEGTGVCGCCGSKAYADEAGNVYLLFRAATNVIHRDMYLLTSTDHGRTFQGKDVAKWNIGACVMSSASLGPSPDGILAAWETEKQTYFERLGPNAAPIAAPGTPNNRKYPVAVSNSRGETLFAWTEGTAWKKGGSVAWQVYGKDLQPAAVKGQANGFPVWSLVAAFAKPDGSFVVVY